MGRVDVGPHPHGVESGEHQAEEHRAVECARDDDPVPGAPHGEGERLVPVRRAADGEAADVRSPETGSASLGLREHPPAELHRVESGVERHVARDNVAHEVAALLVPRDREGRRGVLVEAQPGVEQGRLATQPARVSRHGRPRS